MYNYTGITIDWEYCFESRPKEECASDEEIEKIIDSGILEFAFEIEYKQLDMQNQDEPLQNVYVAHV